MSRIIVLSEPGARIHAEKEHLVVERAGHKVREYPLSSLSEVLCVGRIELSAAAMWRCLRHDIRVVLLTRDGRYLGRLSGPLARNGDLRLSQYRAVTDKGRCLAIAKAIVAAKAQNQRYLLLRRQRDLKDPDLALALVKMRKIVEQLPQAKDVEEVRGLEGTLAQVYFGAFSKLLKNPLFEFHGRNRRPPRDPVNAMLSFGYTVVGALLEGDVEAAGLDPSLGCLHMPAYGRPSLMLDLLEEFRPLVVDTVVVRLINRRQVTPSDFGPPEEAEEEEEAEEAGELASVIPALAVQKAHGPGAEEEKDLRGAVYLRGPGRKVFLTALLGRLRERLFDGEAGGTFELRAIMRNQVYRMARAFVDEECPYKGFVAKG